MGGEKSVFLLINTSVHTTKICESTKIPPGDDFTFWPIDYRWSDVTVSILFFDTHVTTEAD